MSALLRILVAASGLCLLVPAVSGTAPAQQDPAPRRFAAPHSDRGLPDPDAVWTPYAADPAHALNRIWRAAWLVDLVPKEVAGALEREWPEGGAEEFYAAGWYFAKRPGTAADHRLFGGDGRQMPRERFDDEESAALRADLAALTDADVAALKRTPRLAVWFQHDLLRLARRLTRTKSNPELLAPLWDCARRVALPAAVLTDRAAVATTAGHATILRRAGLGEDAVGEAGGWVEVQRKSSRLFDAEYTLMWSSVWLRFPEGADPADWLGPDEVPPVPVGTRALLAQGLVAVDDTGTPRATPLVVDVRLQQLTNTDPLAADNPTTTRDGVDFRMWSLERQRVRERLAAEPAAGVGFDDFRELAMDDQQMFRDYGSLKHTTFAAQCTLCHRRTHTPESTLGGFPVLRPRAGPRPVRSTDERLRQAEREAAKFLEDLRAAASGS